MSYITSNIPLNLTGDAYHHRLLNFRNTTCQATLSFNNATFLPLSAFAVPKNCAGDQIVRFRIPESVPNGAAALEW